NGRRYQSYRTGAHFIPNDEHEQDRMDLTHHIYMLLTGGNLYFAPISNPRRVLDLGTGTGIWAIDFADQHPNSFVIGNDLSPIQPSWLPPNLIFEVDDFESEWAHTGKFDFIHSREIEGMVKDFDRLFEQAFDALNPGGWLEFQSIELARRCDDDSYHLAAAFDRWRDLVHSAAQGFGKRFDTIHSWPDRMKRTGFTNVRREILNLPFSPWPKDPKLKELGRYQQINLLQGMVSYSLFLFTNVLGWSQADVYALLVDVQAVLRNPAVHFYTRVHFVYGQKPY
ncbi:hypothetical protein ASPZODRAFT_71432, partial [Penicilliopsis zonata CBS 506.65]